MPPHQRTVPPKRNAEILHNAHTAINRTRTHTLLTFPTTKTAAAQTQGIHIYAHPFILFCICILLNHSYICITHYTYKVFLCTNAYARNANATITRSLEGTTLVKFVGQFCTEMCEFRPDYSRFMIIVHHHQSIIVAIFKFEFYANIRLDDIAPH